MTQIALMIGISEYGSGLNPLPSALGDLEAMQKVLPSLEKGGFDEVKYLSNPNPPIMREAIETLFYNRQKNDLILLFFSGHIIQDDQAKLYFSTSVSCKTSRPELIRVSAIPASFVQDLMNSSECQQIVLILDYCLDNIAFTEINPNNGKFLDIKAEFEGEGRVILSCFNPSKKSWSQEEIDLDSSVYTSYLTEGIKTGIADLNDDGWIAAYELHQYASNKLQIVAPTLKPEFYGIGQASEILLLNIVIDDPKLQYRKEVEKWVSFGEISQASRYILDKLSTNLSLNPEDCQAIQNSVLKPYQEYQEKLTKYQKEYEKAIYNITSLDEQKRVKLSSIQYFLGLKNEDAALIEEQVSLNKEQIIETKNELDSLPQDSKNLVDSIPSIPDVSVIFSEVSIVSQGQQSEQTVTSSEDLDVIFSELKPISQQDNSDSQGQAQSQQIVTNSEDLDIISPVESIDFEGQKQFIQTVTNNSSLINLHPLPPSIIVPEVAETPNEEFVTKDAIENVNTSNSPYKFIIPIGIGGIITTIGVVFAFSNRTPITPPPVPTVGATTIPEKPPIPRPTISNSPTPFNSPESKSCTVFVNGNLRSEPTYFQNNVVESLREPVLVTGKQTKSGWVEVKMPNDKLAWAYQDIIAEKDRKEMNDCLNEKKITITLIEDLLPPASTTSP